MKKMSNTQFQSELVKNLLSTLETHQHVFVKFQTKAGIPRTMTCTRNLKHVPECNWNGRFEPQLNKEKIVCIYDYQNSAWRAFRKDSVISFTFQEE